MPFLCKNEDIIVSIDGLSWISLVNNMEKLNQVEDFKFLQKLFMFT